MGYYTGKGVTSGGSSTVSLRNTGPAVGGAFYVYQRVKATITRRSGVSLADCTGVSGDMNMTYWQWPGGMVEPACRGTRSSATYAQISGSNLYELVVTDEVVQVRGKQGSYDSGWVG